ncbi:DUF4177 domain-containing protein [Alteromonadaceae bacterium M269]|nr:DUF4177 domain-containing protein [Alteromonadaceae bacterium M269]
MQWEYKIVTLKIATKGFFSSSKDVQPIEAQMNELGRVGWELVNMDFPNHQSFGSNQVTAVFKKRKS